MACALAWLAPTWERGQDDVAEIEYDILADLVDGFRPSRGHVGGRQPHARGHTTACTMEHSLRCQATGDMAAGCWFHREVVACQGEAMMGSIGRHKLLRLDQHLAIGPAT